MILISKHAQKKPTAFLQKMFSQKPASVLTEKMVGEKIKTGALTDPSVGGNWALPQNHEESIPRTHTQEIVGWQDGLFVWK